MIYREKEIAFALKLLKISLGQSSINEKIFSKIICELNSFDLSLNKDNVQNTNKLISPLQIIENINVTHDQTETQFILKKTDDKWRFFVTLNALEYKKFSKILDFEWIVGSLNIELTYSAPYLFLLKNGNIKVVLTDYLDIYIFCSILSTKKNDLSRSCKNFEELLSVSSLKYRFSQEKVNYALEPHRILNDNCYEFEIDKLFSVKNTCGSLNEATEIVQSISKNDKTKLFYSLYEIAIKADEGLQIALEETGFSKWNTEH